MIVDPIERERVARAIAALLERELRRQNGMELDELRISGGLAGVLRSWTGTVVDGWSVSCTAQDLDDKTQGSAEDICGADIYVGISVRRPNGARKSKGFLVQSKMGPDLVRSADLVEQCEKMGKKTQAPYVWIYGDKKIEVLKGEDILGRRPYSRDPWPKRKLKDVVDAILKCDEGDRDFGLPRGLQSGAGLRQRIRELRVPLGFALDATKRV